MPVRNNDDTEAKPALVSGKQFREQFRDTCSNANKLTIISAYLTLPALVWLRSFWKSDCQLLCRLKVSDLLDGASDIEALKFAIDAGWTLYFNEATHSKIYLIDNGPLFIGSANLTSRGLGLAKYSNQETMICMYPANSDLAYIASDFAEAKPLTLDLVIAMETFISDFREEEKKALPSKWPEYIFPEDHILKVSDFPLVGPGETCREYIHQPNLTFAEITNWCKTPIEIERMISTSKAYIWLKTTLAREELDQAWFGYLTAKLHDDLADDPAPYRKTVKLLLSNLLEFCACYMKKEISIVQPRKSQLIKLLN